MHFRRRLLLLYLLFAAGLLVIWMRATQLQWIDGDVWAQEARRQRQHEVRLEPLRGPIISADGQILAEDLPVFQLAVVAWDWKFRARARCSSCGAIHYPRRSGRLPRTCSCERALGRGRGVSDGDDYPRAQGRVEGVPLERLPSEDLEPLERALELEPGALEKRAQARIQRVEELVAYLKEQLEESGDAGAFLKSRLTLKRRDLMHRPYVIASNLSEQAVRLVRTNEAGRYRGFRVVVTRRRRYPQGDFAPQMLGFTSQLQVNEFKTLYEERKDPVTGLSPVTRSTVVGRTGLERAYDAQLQGEAGHRVLERDASGSFRVVMEEHPPTSGPRLGLSVSLAASRQAEKDLFIAAPESNYLPGGKPSGGFVMLDAETGETLIWAEAPRFDLNTELGSIYDPELANPVADKEAKIWKPRDPLTSGMDLETWRGLLVLPVPITWSRVARVAVEPGSTFKPLIALGLLRSGRPLPFLPSFYCANDGRMPHCHNCRSIGLVRAITKSCNRYFAFSVRDSQYWPVYRNSIAQFIEDLGFGQAPGEVAEWGRGQWLWSTFDFPLSDAVANAHARLEQQAAKRREEAERAGTPAPNPPVVPRILLSMQPGAPSTVGGDPLRLGRTLASVAAWVARKSGSENVALNVSRDHVDGNQVTLRFGLRAARRRPWFTLPGLDGAEEEMPAVLRGRAAEKAGLRGRVERGGTVWFTARFERRSGRPNADAPPRIGAGDGRFVAIGQGPVLTTPLQMARAMTLLANGRALVTPHLVRSIGPRRMTHEETPVALDPRHLAQVRAGMLGVTQSPEGTAYRRYDGTRYREIPWDRLPARVYGKTGTAQVGASWRPWETVEGKGPWHHWFVGYATAPGRRTVAFACVLHSRTEGAAGSTAAPAVQRILEHWYTTPESRSGR